jgi:D-xylose transport system permease protein
MSAAAGAAPAAGNTLRDVAQRWWTDVKSGELGSLPIIFGLIIIAIVFQSQNDRFLTSGNFVNLIVQSAAYTTIAMGIVFVLLLGEIDLSVGFVSGVAGVIATILLIPDGNEVPTVVALAAALGAGAAIGTLHGILFAKVGIPSFVVTLAGLIGFQGALLLVLGDTGTVALPPGTITDLTGTFFDPFVGWIIAVAVVAAYIAAVVIARSRRQKAGLEVPPLIQAAIAPLLVTAATIAAVVILNADRGVPLAVVIVVGLTAIFAFITERTRFGRHIFAVGGNAEASRRAGIRINRVRVAVFTISSTLAAFGGILAASRLLAVNQQSGSGELLLFAIAGPVIAGTSLFGGRGFVWSALLGAIVIGSISNGMDLLALESDIKFIITGAVLLAAVTIDAATRLRREAVR